MSDEIKLSVVIPTMGRPIVIETLKSLIRCRGFESTEVIVAGKIKDEAILEQLQQLQREHPRIVHLPIQFEQGDSSEKKNAGFHASKAEIVAFLDDDVIVAPDWPLLICEPFENPAVGLVSGPSLIPEDINLVGRLAGLALASRAAGYVADRYRQGQDETRPINWSRIIGCNAAYRRKAFEGMGTFDPAFYPGEEMIASHKTQELGWTLMFIPRAYVYHYPRQSIQRFWKQMWGYGATRIRLFRGGVEFEPATIVPMIWVLSLIVLGLGSVFSEAARILFLMDLGLYALADLFITLEMFNETRRFKDFLLFLLIPVMHVSYGLAEWAEFFRPNKDLSERH
ncbi:MAG: hypothetical protein A2X46_16715 [Lentisphaerae bacterium GWF2_57_35]|nr:MAG: hypothetical protein A2X46_16715 [Lentisphaerae bacterium GWF2_57_35]